MTKKLIYLEDAIDALTSRWLKTINYDGKGEDIAEECRLCLMNMPSAQPERNVGTCDECIHKDRFDYEPPCKMCIRIASKGRDGDYFWKESESE